MLVVPLSSCIADDSGFSNDSGRLSGTDPVKPEPLFTPGEYTIKYYSDEEELLSKPYNGTFAYAARLPDNWAVPDGKVFAGWSKNPNSEDADALPGENASSSTVDYQVYDDIEYDESTGMPVGASGDVLNLYAVWTDAASGVYLNTVYLSQDGNDSNNNGATESAPVKTFSKAYSLLDPNGTTTTNRIILLDNITLDNSVLTKMSESDYGIKLGDVPATISGSSSGSKLTLSSSNKNLFLMLNADTVFENIALGKIGNQLFFYCCGHNLTMGEKINTKDIMPVPDSGGGNNSYAIPGNYPALTILGGDYGGIANSVPSDAKLISSINSNESTNFTIKLIDGVYGRVSGFGRSYEGMTDRVETLCPTIIVSDSARVGTLAAGHLDSNATTGVDSPGNFKTAELIIRTNNHDTPYNTNNSTSTAVVYLVGGNIGNNKENTFLGNVEISVYCGTVDNIYGAGLGRYRSVSGSDVFSSTYMSGAVNIFICGGKIENNVYGGGAAASLSSSASIGSASLSSYTHIQVQGGNIIGSVYGGGYGKSDFIPGDKLSLLSDVAGQVIGSTNVVVMGGTISGSVYGGGEGIDDEENVAKVTGSTSVYVSDGTISGNVYGGGSIAIVEGSTSVTIAGGTIGGRSRDGGRVFGGGEGNLTYDWAGQVAGNTNVTISKGVIKGSVYGGGNYGAVGSASEQSSTTVSATVHIGPDEPSSDFNNSSIQIAGSVYGGGRGDESEDLTSKGVTKGNVYGNTNVTISGGNIGYNNGDWYNSESAGSVFGGGKLGLVTGTTDVTISGGEIHRNVFGGGKGLSKSVFIELSGDGSEISSRLYNLLALGLSPEDKNSITGAIGSNLNYVTKYVWESSNILDSGFEEIKNSSSNSLSESTRSILTSDVPSGHSYVRLTVYAENDTIGEEEVFSNVICINPNINSEYTNKTAGEWYLENREMVQFGAVVGGTSVTVTGGNIHTNVYGGGSYAVVGTITGEDISPSETSSETLSDTDSTTYNFKHKLSGGETSVTIKGGTIGFNILEGSSTDITKGPSTHPNSNIGNIFGGGMGEPDMITAGAVGGSAKVIIESGTVHGNIYGGGANGFVGPVTIEISDTMSEISTSSGEGIGTWSYNLNIAENNQSAGSGATSVTVNNGTIGYDPSELTDDNLPNDYSAEEHGNIFGAGMGGNATVTGSGNVTLNATGQITINGNVYGGGELGIVGQLTGQGTGSTLNLKGGDASVSISGTESIAINGSVFGGGKGRFTTSPSDAILGAVGSTSKVNILSSVTIKGNVFGGGELSIVGSYDKIESDGEGNDRYTFEGGAASVNISNGKISGNVYGGGEGDPRNIVSGATGSTKVIISGNSTSVEENVYGGGAYGLVGSSVTTTLYERSHPITDSDNAASSTVVILGGTVKGSVFGGGYGPNATIGGSTYVFIGKLTSNFHFPSDANSDQLDIIIHGNVYGGGEMGPVGFFYNNGILGDAQLSSNVMITSNSKSIKIDGNVYGGGKGWDLALIYNDNTKKEISKIQALMPGEKPSISGTESYDILSGYAIVYGNTVVNISGSGIIIDKCVYGGGEGVLRSGSIILTGNDKGKIDYKEVLASLPYGQVTGNDSGGASVTITEAKVHENVYGGGNTGLIGTYTKTADGAADKVFTIEYSGKPVSVIIDGAEIGVTDASGHTESGGDDITSGNVFGAGKGNDEGILLGAVGSSTVEIKGNAHIVKVTKLGSQTLDNLTDADNKTVLERAIALSGNVYGGGDYGIVGNSVTVKVNLNHNYNTADNANHTSGYDPFKAHYVDSYSTTKDIVTVSISGTSQIDGNVYGGGKGTFDSHGSNGEVDLGDDELIKPTMSAGYGTVYGSVKVTMSEGTVSGNVYGGGKGSLNETCENEGEKNENILHSIPYGQITGLDSSRMPAPAGTEQLSTSSIAASVFISGGTVKGSVFGGGQLGILGTFDKNTRYFDGKDSLVVIFSDTGEVKINNSVFGGGEGAASSSVSGAVRDTTVIIGQGALIGKDAASGEANYSEETIDGTTLRLYYGNVYGGGKLSITGSATVKSDDAAKLESSDGYKDNSSNANVIILGGEIKRNVYGGGFSPKASIAGSTHVWIGGYTSSEYAGSPNISGSLAHVGYSQGERNLKTDIKISGSVYGGGEMGSVGTSLIDLDDPSSFDTSDTGKNPNGQELVSANVSIKYDSSSITIGDTKHKDGKGSLLDGVFGGGEGIQNYGSGDDIEVSGIKGYAIVRGSAYVEIEGNLGNNSNLTINGSVYGGGRGAQYNVESIHYAEVYDSAAVKVSNADVKGDVFGGGKLSIIGHFYDAYPIDNTEVSWFKKDGKETKTYHVNINETDGKAYLVDDSGNYITVKNGLTTTTTDPDEYLAVTYRYFCSDYAKGNGGSDDKISTTTNIPQYAGKGTAAVLINDSNIEGNVYGGGEGVETNILAGAVGRGTVVTIDDSTDGNYKTEINGNVYGGGKLGIVGSVMTEIIGTGGIGNGSFSTTKVSHTVHSYKPSGGTLKPTDINSANDIDLIVNIFGGHIKGSVFGAGKGEQVCYEGVSYPEKDRISYYKLSVFGRTEVNISDGRIDKHVYGGSENGETGSLTVLKSVKKFADGYWDTNPYNDYRRGAPSDIPKTVRDNGYTKDDGTKVPSTLPSFNAAFVNIVGGTIYGNVFGGGYFGAVHGDTHVHIGWNAMMPDGDTKGDCHFYNNYGDTDENGNTVFRQGGHLPFVERSENIEDLGDVEYTNSVADSLSKEITVHNLFINGTVYAGGDRGDPSAVTVNYDYISVYGTSHIFVNGEGYTTGTDTPKDNKEAMYIQGSLFGSGNSCTTFYSDKADTRFIIIRNYDAVNDDKLNNFIIYSIQRATEVTLVNSSLRLPGRSDGSNLDTSALYSLNHISVLILRGGSTLILDTEVNDLREFRSVDGTGTNTTLSNPVNTLQLNNGIILIIAQVEGELNATASPEEEALNENKSSDISEAANFTSLKKFIFGPVNGYSFVNLDSSSPEYYGGYIYGQYLSSGGFAYGSSFDSSVQGTAVNVVHYEATDDNLGYDVWKPTNGVVSSPATLIADENKMDGNKSESQEGFYEATGSVTLPMTVAGSIYELRGYNIIPSHAASVSGDDRSLRLMSIKDGKLVPYSPQNYNTDFGLLMSLNKDTFTGSIEGGIPSIWIDPTVDMFGQRTSAGAVGGNVLPQIDFTLYFRDGISKTGIAGEVVIYLQERLPVRNSTGAIIDYLYGDQIKVVLTIQTQNVADPEEEGNMDIYPHSIDGTSSWYFVVPPIGDGKTTYEFTLQSVSVKSGSISLEGEGKTLGSNGMYQLIMSAADNQDRSHGWSGYSLQNRYLTDNDNYDEYVGTTDGRFGATLQFILMNKTGESDYTEGTVTITFKLVTIKSDGTREDPQTLTLNINIKNKVPNFTVDFITDSGASYVPSQIVDSGNTVKKPADPSMIVTAPETQNLALGNKVILGEDVISLEFGGWYADENYTTLFDFTKPITGNTKVYALFSCKVTFDSQGGSGVPPEYVIQGKTVAKPADPTKKGYTFIGWYLKDAEYNFSSLVTSNITLEAKWETANVYVEYNMNGSDLPAPTDNGAYQLTGNDSITLSSEYNTNTTTIDGITYKFAGWALTSSNPGKIYSASVRLSEVIDSAVLKGKDYKITFYAVWIPNEEHLITITADPEGSAGFTYSVENNGTRYSDTYTGPFSVKSGSTVEISYVENNGYKYNGYECNGTSYTKQTITLNRVTKDQNITVKFTVEPFDVTLNPNGGKFENEDPVKIQVTPNGNYPSLDSYKLTREHYKFLGWFTEQTGGTLVTANTKVILEVTTLYAHWELDNDEFSIIFNYYYSGCPDSLVIKVPYKYDLTLPPESDPFVREGYKLTGWTLNATTGIEYKPGAPYGAVESDLIFYAHWESADNITHTVTFNPNGGILTERSPVTVNHGASIGNNMPSDPTREGYEFLGWFNTPETSAEFTSSSPVIENITVYAHWGKLNTITFNSNGGSKVDPITGKPGDNITKPADPTKQGYIFAGWYKEETFQMEFVFSTMPSSDITLYAKWIEENDPDCNFKVEYNANGGIGEVPGPEFHYAGSTVTVKPADLKNNECRFIGWQSSADGKLYRPGDQFRMPFKDVCLTAVWSSSPEDDKATVTFCVDNETYAKVTVNRGMTLSERMPSVPEKEGCIFAGWFTSDGVEFTSETAVSADITVYAKWNLKEGYTLVTYIIDSEIYMTQVCLKSKITEPYIPSKSGKELNGWYTDEELKNKFDFSSAVEEDSLTLYAEWKDSPNFMVWFIFILFAFFIAAVIASAKKVSFYKDENDEERYASVVMIGRGALGDKFPQSPDNENFSGWFSEEGELITAETEIRHSMKLYARWKD